MTVATEKPNDIVIANTRKLRRARQLTAASFAERLTEAGWAISRVGVTKLEGGYRSGITVNQLTVLADVLGVTTEQLLKPLKVRAAIVIEEGP